MLIDMSVLQDQNISRTEYKKFSLYKDLQIENTKIWKLSSEIIQVETGTFGMLNSRNILFGAGRPQGTVVF